MKIKFCLGVFFTLFATGSLWAQTGLPAGWLNSGCNLLDNSEYLIRGNTTWSGGGVHQVEQVVRVLDGSVLEIKDITLNFVPGTEIIVEVGGKLRIGFTSGTTVLTSTCPTGAGKTHIWKGITVRGNSGSSDQTDANQGIVEAEDCTISHAEVAIQQNSGCLGEGGGIIQVNRVEFLNNKTALKFTDYQHADASGAINASSVKDCTFEINTGYSALVSTEVFDITTPSNIQEGWRVYDQIILDHNNGLTITNCQFLNHFDGWASPLPSTSTTYTKLWAHPDWQGSAIVGRHSDFSVVPSTDCTGRNRFEGWYYGVFADFSDGFANRNVVISGCDFVDNKYGTLVNHCENVTITDNEFGLTEAVWQRYLIENGNAFVQDKHNPKSPSSYNFYGAYVKRTSVNLTVAQNRFTVDWPENFGAVEMFTFRPETNDAFPALLDIEENLFEAEIQGFSSSGTTPQGIIQVTGINIWDLGYGTTTNNVFQLDCNTFDLDLNPPGATTIFMPQNHNYRYDLRIRHATGSPTVNITSGTQNGSGTTTPPENHWTDYSLGANGGGAVTNYEAFHIGSDFPVTYTHGSTASTDTSGNNIEIPIETTTPPVSVTQGSLASSACPADPCWWPSTSQAPSEEEPLQGYQIENTAFYAYPNPASEMLQVETKAEGNVTIVGLDGREVISSRSIDEGQNQIDISALSPGEYILHFNGEKGSHTTKFMKE